MKRLFLLFSVLCATVVAQAQVISAYTVEASEGTYIEISDGTAMDTTDMSVEDAMNKKVWHSNGVADTAGTYQGFPIGFDFEFNDNLFNQFVIGSNGYIALGDNEGIAIDPDHGPFVFIREDDADNTIGVLPNADIYKLDETEISYKVLGDAPNRTLVVQYKNWGVMLGWSEEALVSLNYQIRLNETSNTIEFVFGEATGSEEYSKPFRMGLRGYYDDLFSLGEGEEEGMLNFVGSADDNSSYVNVSMITSGLTYTFTAPDVCEKPTESVTLSNTNVTTNSLSIYWAPLAEADKAIWLLKENDDVNDTPLLEDGKHYSQNDSIGNYLVLTCTSDTLYESDYYDLKLKPATSYSLYCYTLNSLCKNGPLYNDTFISTGFKTLPDKAKNITVTNTELETITFDVEANDVDNVAVLLSKTVVPNPPFANEILFGEISGEPVVGQEIDTLSRVVYVGGSAENVVVKDLEPGTTYYLRAVSYDNEYRYATEYAEDACVTVATLPWSIDLTYTDLNEVPVGWESEAWTVSNKANGYGDDDRQFNVKITPNATDGYVGDLTTPRILVNEDNAFFSFEYCMYYQVGWMGKDKYDAWEAEDTLAVQVSSEGGEFEDVLVYTAENNAKVDSINQFTNVSVDLSKYLDKEIRVRIHWKCHSSQQVRMPIEDITLVNVPKPVVPEVTVNDITHNSALLKWRGEQENYEVAYAKSGEEFDTIVVEGATELVLTELEAEVKYQVKVRGIIAEEEYTDWSEITEFETTAWPACEAPTKLEADVTSFTEDGTVTLTWEGNEEHLYYGVRYRESSSTTWVEIDSLTEATVVLEDLEAKTTYLWNVRANCTADRVTDWSAQATFETPEIANDSVLAAPVITAEASNDTVYVYWNAVKGAVGYNLYYQNNLLDSFVDTVVAIQVVQAGEYCFTITAFNENKEESEQSNEACATVVAPEGLEVPEAPVLTAKIEGNYVVLSWEPVENATYYVIYFGDKLLGNHNETSLKLELPEPGTYCFTVAAANLAGASEPSNEACVTYGEGLEELSSSINIYPNPVENELFLTTEMNVESVAIYDIYGRQTTVYGLQTTDFVHSINVAELNSGVYFVKVVTNEGEIVKRFVKK